MKGLIRLAKVLTPATSDNGYRCNIQALDTNSIYVAICNPSPYGWANPDINALVYFLDAPYAKRIIGVLHDIDVSIRPMSDVAEQEELPSSVATSFPGDVYYGKYGRISLPNSGDVDLISFSTRSRLFFENATGTSSLSGYNLDLFTAGQPIRMFTQGSTAGGIGDILSIQSNSVGASGTNLSTIQLDNKGNVSFYVGYTGSSGPSGAPTPITNMGMNVAGQWQAYVGGSTFSNSYVSLLMQSSDKTAHLVSQGDIFLQATNNVNVKATNLWVTSKVGVTGDVQIQGNSQFKGNVGVTGNVAIKGNVTLEGDMTVKATNAQINASSLVLGGDGALAIVIAQKIVAWLNAHTHPTTAPGAPSGPPMVPVTEAQIASIITKAK